ncbi:MAG: hypothetical protein ABIH87_03850 [bacterium]
MCLKKAKKSQKYKENTQKLAKKSLSSVILVLFLAVSAVPLTMNSNSGHVSAKYSEEKLAKNTQKLGPVFDHPIVSEDKEPQDDQDRGILSGIKASVVVKTAEISKKSARSQETMLSQARDVAPKLEVDPGIEKPDKVVRSVITAYTSTPDQTDDSPFIAASGKHVYDGMVAANWLPFGTKLKIPELYGEKIFTVDDRMNSRYGHGRMDIWMDAPRAEAIQFGVKTVDVEVYYQTAKLALNK